MRELLKGSLTHKVRLAQTAVGVALAVGLVCGTFALSATIDAGYRRALAATHAGASVLVRPAPAFAPGEGVSDRTAVPEHLLATVQATQGVARAWGSVSGYAEIAGDAPSHKLAAVPSIGRAWTPGDTLSAGRAPAAAGEVVVAESTARARGLHVGDRILIVFQQGTAEFVVTGLGAGEESAPVAFDLATAQALYDRTGRYDEIAVRAEPALPATALRAQLASAVGGLYEVVTSADASEQASRSWSGALRFLTPGLLVFSLVALLVSAFIIFNTFSILVGQRSREFGLARVLGASRAQVMLSVLLEAAVVGLAASVAGVALGAGAAHGLLALLRAVGFSLPSASVVFSLSTVVVGVAAGVLVTVLAAALPAHRATAVAPVSAVSAQDGDIGTSPRRRWATGLFVMGSGAGALLIGLH
ncbi:MAG: ABC transporter permease, partial [Acidimicrobiales bacterium]